MRREMRNNGFAESRMEADQGTVGPPIEGRVDHPRPPARHREILHHGPPPAYAYVGGAEPWPQVHPGILRGVRAAAGL